VGSAVSATDQLVSFVNGPLDGVQMERNRSAKTADVETSCRGGANWPITSDPLATGLATLVKDLGKRWTIPSSSSSPSSAAQFMRTATAAPTTATARLFGCDKARAESAARADALAAAGDPEGAAVWRRITDAVAQLENETPPGPVH
jgi:hypothetical protein